MQFILQIYKRLFGWLTKKDQENTDTKTQNDIIFSVDIDANYMRNISIYIPEDINEDNIMQLSEAFAETIVELGNGITAQQIMQTLQQSINKKDPTEKLFLDNILFGFLQKSQLNMSNSDPMIKPSKVFK